MAVRRASGDVTLRHMLVPLLLVVGTLQMCSVGARVMPNDAADDSLPV